MSFSKLKIEGTQNTPEVILDPSGLIKISGRSLDICSLPFIASIDEWLEIYITSPADITRVVIELDYLNRVNIRYFSSLLKKLNTVRFLNKKLVINWIYEEGDEDMHEIGDLISSSLMLPMNFVEREEEDNVTLKRSEKDLPYRVMA
ncbi:MAG TPA: SiaC family regulatory phosphoprotein [Bacteroidales bacterium]|nr:SiaC family regulatory phosphoprotein [Bacteroidales bacterium]